MDKSEGDVLSSTFVWKIKNFPELPDNVNDSYSSPQFSCCENSWKIMLYPYGETTAEIGYVAIFLNLQDPNVLIANSKLVVYEISIRRSNGTNYMCRSGESYFSREKPGWGWSRYVKKKDLMKELKEFAFKGTLLISCTISSKERIASEDMEAIFPETAASCIRPSSIETLARNLKELYLSGNQSDVTINVKDHEIYAHKVILGARSSVLAATFAHNMKENSSGVLKIEDFEPDIVSYFLQYIYTADTDMLDSENVLELYKIAHKYAVEQLTKECVKFMARNINVETVCDVLHLSEMYDETQLHKCARTFVENNAREVLLSDEWRIFRSQNNLAHDTLAAIILKNERKTV